MSHPSSEEQLQHAIALPRDEEESSVGDALCGKLDKPTVVTLGPIRRSSRPPAETAVS
jgi:hypothetical protein